MDNRGTGIICEYNPFHKGHAYQISAVKEQRDGFVVCAMSGDFVQRAESAFQDKYVRAQNAVENGADIVLEIPFPFSSLGAEGFARAGVSILEKSGLCSHIAFGSECADTEKLQKLATLLNSDFNGRVFELQKRDKSSSFALIRENLVREILGDEYADILKNPNDILAVEYLKASNFLSPIAILRTTPRSGYDDNFASSGYIRKIYSDTEKRTLFSSLMPENVSLEKIYGGDSSFYNHVLLSLMQKNPEDLSNIAEVSGGCEYSIIKNALISQSFDELCERLSSKTLTYAKIRRMLLFSFFSVTQDMAKKSPRYTFVLASSDLGKKMLKKYSSDREITVASRISDIKKDTLATEQYDFSRRCSEVLSKCRKIMG